MIHIKLACLFALLMHFCVLGATFPQGAISPVDNTASEVEFVPLEEATTTPKIDTTKNKKVVEDADFWRKVGTNTLLKHLKTAKKAKETNYQRKAKNIIFFVGDGMGVTTITAGRIFKGQYLKHNHGEEETLAFDEFPYTGMSKTYNVDDQVPDSAGTATAMFTGVKTDHGAIGVDATRSPLNATQGLLASVMEWAQAEGKRTGIVTTTRITHATPSAAYAHIYHRDWESDLKVPAESKDIFADIARQLVENQPGNKLNVIMGGGLGPMGAFNAEEKTTVAYEGSTEKTIRRGDGRDLTQEWLQLGGANDTRFFVKTREQLLNIQPEKTDHLLGLFRNNHLTYAITKEEEEPTLQEMVKAAIGVLERGKESNGYVLMVEGGRIDQAHHQNYARAAMHEMLHFDMAIETAVNMTNDEETLIIVTADHSHAVTLNGYPVRGADILGFANRTGDPMAYETITYANGPGYWDHLANGTRPPGSTNIWLSNELISQQKRDSPTYRHQATFALKDESHGGEDVVAFASGPGGSLVRGVFEQNYLAYVMSYAGCMGPAKDIDGSCKATVLQSKPNSASVHGVSLLLMLGVLLSLLGTLRSC